MFPEHIYHLAFSALYTLNKYYISAVSSSNDFKSSNYIGLHLQISTSAIQAGSYTFENQSKHYLELASSRSYTVAYLASDNRASKLQFEDMGKDIIVVDKEDLLYVGHKEAQRANLTSDQLSLVDYLILEKASYFAGFMESSFSWNVAGKRRAMRAGMEGICGRQAEKLGRGVAWRDEWSEIVGVTDGVFEHRLWP